MKFWRQPPASFGAALLVAAAATLSAALVLLAGWAFDVLDGDYAPMYGPAYAAPQVPEEERVASGGILHVTTRKCSREAVALYGVTTWRRLSPSIILRTTGLPATRQFDRGCETISYANEVPKDLPPGIWVLSGSETAYSGSDEQRLSWTTTPFEVVAR